MSFKEFLLNSVPSFASYIGIGISIWQRTFGTGSNPVTPSWVLTADGAPAAIDFDFANNRAYVNGSVGTPDSFLTCTRASTRYVIDATGTYVSVLANTLGYTYNATTLAAEGVYIEEARTNSIRNNSMQGAVVGAARNVGTITAIARTASATAVVATGTHTVAVNDQVTISGATPADYNGTYLVTAVVANVSFSYITANVATDTAAGYTVTAISSGTAPTNWIVPTTFNGLSRGIISLSTENGIDYIDIRYAGITSSIVTGVNLNSVESNTQIAAVQNQIWSGSEFIILVGGTNTGVTYFLRTVERDGAGVFLAQSGVTIVPAAGNLREARKLNPAYTLTNASTAFVNMAAQVNIATATYVDFIIRFGWPQLELGASVSSPIRTTTVAVARSADVVSMTLPAMLQNLLEYTEIAYAKPQTPVTYGINQNLLAISDGTTTNRISLARLITTGIASVLNSASPGASSGVVWTQNTSGKLGQGWKSGNGITSFNGGSVLDAGAGVISGVNKFCVGVNPTANASFWDGTITRNTLFNFRASNMTIQTLTT